MILCYNNSNDSRKVYGLEIKQASKNNQLRIYDKRQKKFFKDANCTQKIDIKGETILTRATSDNENNMLTEAVLKQGGEVICNDPITNSNIRRWPKFVQTQRKTIMIQGTDILGYDLKQLKQILDTVSEENESIFFKTKSGDFSRVIKKDELLQEDSILRRIINKYPDEEYILSQPIQIEQDRLGNREYRSIVVDNKKGQTPKVASISRYTPDTYHQISREVAEECKKIADTFHSKSEFPEKYVLDLVEYKDPKTGQTKIDVLELKPVNTASFEGIYNSVYDLEEDEEKQEQNDEELCHEGSYIYNIALEKKRDFIERGEIPSAIPSGKIIPLEKKKDTKFAKAYEAGHEIVNKSRLLNFRARKQKKAKEKQADKKQKNIEETGA